MCLYIDDSVRNYGSFAVAGGIVYSQDGKWILGYNRYLGICSVFDVEFGGGILDESTFLFDWDYDRVLILLIIFKGTSYSKRRRLKILILHWSDEIINCWSALSYWCSRRISKEKNQDVDGRTKPAHIIYTRSPRTT